MRTCVSDCEANGLLDAVTTVWCAVFIDTKTKEEFRFGPDQMEEMCSFMDTCKTLVFHNGFGYDFPVFEKVLGYEYKGNRVDTLLMSRLLYPDRISPKGVKAGPHSVESWGATFRRAKPEHEDWSKFSPEMMHRCAEDAQIQLLLYQKCLRDMKKQGWPPDSLKLTFRLFEILQKQEQNGWPVDAGYMHKSVHMLDTWIHRIDRAIQPYLPWVLVNPYGTEVKKPFKQDRTLTAIAKKWYTTPEEQAAISGPFTRIEFRRTNLANNILS